VTVNSDAPVLQADTSNIQTDIAGKTVVAMPLNTRNFVRLSTLAPGVELPARHAAAAHQWRTPPDK
jgi:hypothetical protein